MKTPFKMTPGRGNMPKTGRGISPTLMSKSPMYQTNIELTEDYTKGVKKAENAFKNKKIVATAEKDLGIKYNPSTREAMPREDSAHKFSIAGSFAREIDSAGKVVKEVKVNPNAGNGGGNAAEALKKSIENRNSDISSRRENNAKVVNTLGGGTKADKLDEEGKQMLIRSGRANVVGSPAKQLSKTATKKISATVMEDKKVAPKAAKKSPMKQTVSKKTAYDIKEASNQKLKPKARKHYAENAQAAMKNKKSPTKMKRC